LKLTEHINMAIIPAASVSGLYFANPESKNFPVGEIQRDQVEDYAHRRMDFDTGERWLAPMLGYDR
jgi:5-methyltetrahydrofolate--homocysteine methyltransferase